MKKGKKKDFTYILFFRLLADAIVMVVIPKQEVDTDAAASYNVSRNKTSWMTTPFVFEVVTPTQ